MSGDHLQNHLCSDCLRVFLSCGWRQCPRCSSSNTEACATAWKAYVRLSLRFWRGPVVGEGHGLRLHYATAGLWRCLAPLCRVRAVRVLCYLQQRAARPLPAARLPCPECAAEAEYMHTAEAYETGYFPGPCDTCDGTGWVNQHPSPCPHCPGDGSVCGACGGQEWAPHGPPVAF